MLLASFLLLATVVGTEQIRHYWTKPESCQSLVLAVKPHVEMLNLLKSFCFEPPEQPEPLPRDEDQWGWNHFWFRHVFILFSLSRLKHQTQLSLICKQASLPLLFTPVLAFPNSFYLCSCAVQENSCQHNIHYYSDKNRVAFTSISQRQHYLLLQNSIKNRRRWVNCHLPAEFQHCLSLLQVDQVWSRDGSDVCSLFVVGQTREADELLFHQHRSPWEWNQRNWHDGVSSIFHWR